MATAKKTDPELWEKVKKKFMKSSKGGKAGQWSARKAQLAVQEYKSRGGGYKKNGPGQGETDLNKWTKQDWGTKSGKKSAKSGERYLPKKIRMLLTEDEYHRSTEKKKADTYRGCEQFSDQPPDVRKKVARIRKNGPTKQMLVERAQDLDIGGRSKMSKIELLKAIDKATDKNGRGKNTRAGLSSLSKDKVYKRAKAAGIEGRSSMTKNELVNALAKSQ